MIPEYKDVQVRSEQTVQRWRCDPFRPLDFRWQDASHVVTGRPTQWADRDDPVLKALIRHQRSLDPANTIRVSRQEREHFAAIRAAHELAQHDKPLRWQAEALILAGASDDEVAKRCVLEPAVVATYEAAFFAVREAAKAHLYLFQQTVGPAVQRGFRNDEVRQLWAWAGMAGGVLLVDELVAAHRSCHRPADQPRLDRYLCCECVPLELKACVASLVLPRSPSAFDTEYLDCDAKLLEAGTLQRPDAAISTRERVACDVVRLGQAVLAGKPVPKSRRNARRGTTASLRSKIATDHIDTRPGTMARDASNPAATPK